MQRILFDRASHQWKIDRYLPTCINGIPLAGSGQANSGPQNKPLDASAPQLSATDVLKDRLKGTKWLNDHNGTFEWTTNGRFLHNGTEYEWKAIDGQRVQITFGSDHVDTLVFNDDFTEFKQLVRGKERTGLSRKTTAVSLRRQIVTSGIDRRAVEWQTLLNPL